MHFLHNSLNPTVRLLTAEYSLMGMLTSPKDIDPFQTDLMVTTWILFQAPAVLRPLNV